MNIFSLFLAGTMIRLSVPYKSKLVGTHKLSSLITTALIVASMLFFPTNGRAQNAEFIPGPGDILRIKNYYPEPAEESVTVSPDNAISYSYLGSISIKGMSVAQIQKTITDRLADGYLKYPVITVSIEQIKSKKIFVFGEVANPSAYPWTPDLTILSAIALAGGFTRYSPFEIQIFRAVTNRSKYERIKFSVAALLSENPKRDLQVLPGDVIVISDREL